jgi:hypothetical protein
MAVFFKRSALVIGRADCMMAGSVTHAIDSHIKKPSELVKESR